MNNRISARLQHILSVAKALGIEDDGQDLIEYALVAGLLGLAAVTAMKTLSTKISNSFSSVGSTLTSAV